VIVVVLAESVMESLITVAFEGATETTPKQSYNCYKRDALA